MSDDMIAWATEVLAEPWRNPDHIETRVARALVAQHKTGKQIERALRALVAAVEQEWRARSPQTLGREEAAVIAARIVLEGFNE